MAKICPVCNKKIGFWEVQPQPEVYTHPGCEARFLQGVKPQTLSHILEEQFNMKISEEKQIITDLEEQFRNMKTELQSRKELSPVNLPEAIGFMAILGYLLKFVPILGYLLIFWVFLDLGLSWMGVDLYYKIGINLSGSIFYFTHWISMGVGFLLTKVPTSIK